MRIVVKSGHILARVGGNAAMKFVAVGKGEAGKIALVRVSKPRQPAMAGDVPLPTGPAGKAVARCGSYFLADAAEYAVTGFIGDKLMAPIERAVRLAVETRAIYAAQDNTPPRQVWRCHAGANLF